MTIDYSSLAADHDPKGLKSAVNLAAVAILYGLDLTPDGDGRLVCRCPFHDDSNPSFAFWLTPEDTWSCGCWSCDFRTGDLFDFLQRWHDFDFRSALAKAVELRDSDLPEVPDAPVNASPAPDMGRALERAAQHNLDGLGQLLHDRGINVPATWVNKEFRVVWDGAEVLIPHFDEASALTGVKRRVAARGWEKLAVRGSQLDHLYGAWRMKSRNQEVVICEGESDTWSVAYLLDGLGIDVVGLPSGVAANVRRDWVELMKGKRVTLLFDADRAGRESAGRWMAALIGVAREVLVACLPDGSDATSASRQVVEQMLAEAWPATDISKLPIRADGSRYVRPSGNDDKADTVLSDFVMIPKRLVVMDDGGIVFELKVPNKIDLQFLTGAELASVERMRRWCADRLLSWKGSARDLSDLLELLKAQSLLIPRVRGTDVVGLHGDVFVLPDEVIGSAGWGYVPPENDVNLGAALRLAGGEWDRELPGWLCQLHQPDVVTPIIGWVAAAPLRSIVAKFPVLGVVGGSGWGKTTLLATILDAFGFWCLTPTTLTGTTAHAVHSYAGSTNAFPIWFDEYRPGARAEAKLALDQTIRDAWDGSATIKGGLSENRMKIKKLPARAPIVVTGEDAFTETSHAERMVMIAMPKDGRNARALRAVQGARRDGFGRAYLLWLLEGLRSETLPGPPAIPDRTAQARRVAAWGYELLDQFCQEVLGYRLPKFDDQRAESAHRQAEEVPIILEALLEAVDRSDSDGKMIAWADGDDVVVKPQQLCVWAERNRYQLPGGSRAVAAWLREQYGAFEVKHPAWGRALRVPGAGTVSGQVDT